MVKSPVPDSVIQSQLTRSTCLPRFNSDVKICVTESFILVLFGLFLPVMCIRVDLQVLKIWDFRSTLKSRQAKFSQAKASRQHGKPSRVSLVNMAEGGC